MSTRAEITKQAAEGLSAFAQRCESHPVMIGFDGCVDSIISVVDQRYDAERYDPVTTIEQFGKKVLAAAGKSSNYELVVRDEKLGGNAVIMANAMASMGVPVTCIAALGGDSAAGVPVHPVFWGLSGRADCVSLGEPGHTEALEFSDGKLMLGRVETFSQIDWGRIEDAVGKDQVMPLLQKCDLLGMVNWTMLPRMGQIWQRMIDDILPSLNGSSSRARKQVFVDLADPEKRTRDDLKQAMEQCAAMQRHADVIIGLNLKEAVQVAKVLGLDPGESPEGRVEALAQDILTRLAVNTIVIHPRKSAAAAQHAGDRIESAFFAGPFVAKPKISTGGGDHFNAGFCTARLAGLPLAQCLCVGTATSGYYVSSAQSPSLEQLTEFCNNMLDPDPAAR